MVPSHMTRTYAASKLDIHEGIFDVTAELQLNLQSSKSSHMWLLSKDFPNQRERKVTKQLYVGKEKIWGGNETKPLPRAKHLLRHG